MVSYFSDNSTHPYRAQQAWLILIGRARNRQTLTYSMLNELMGYGSAQLGAILDYIWNYCLENNMPPLTIIVVSKTTGQPSAGMGEFTFKQQEQVFEFDWYGVIPPTAEELANYKRN